MSQGSLDPKIRFIGQKVCSVARVQTDRHTDTQTDKQTQKWIQRTPFQGFRNVSFNLSSRIGPISLQILHTTSDEFDCMKYKLKFMLLWFDLKWNRQFSILSTHSWWRWCTRQYCGLAFIGVVAGCGECRLWRHWVSDWSEYINKTYNYCFWKSDWPHT